MSAGKRDAAPSAFRNDPVALYDFVGCFFESLAAAGVEHVCISPGSRSTPLAVAADRTTALRIWVGLDERATSFFALGLAKATRRAVAIVCTSGTAAANYLPAIIEAHYARVPLLVLTADRPPELRDWGAGQTIEQPGLYGRYPRWAAEVALAAPGEDGLRYASQLAGRAVDEASGVRPGPVHLNWPFREPLAPPPGGSVGRSPSPLRPPRFSRARAAANPADVEDLGALAESRERGVICCGPMDPDAALRRALARLASATGWPILADPASQLRGAAEAIDAPVLSLGDAMLRAPGFAARMRPEVVVRIGETPVSKAQRLWIEASAPAEVWWLDEGSSWGEPSQLATRIVRGGAAALLGSVADRLGDRAGRESPWCRGFEAAERVARAAFDERITAPGPLSGIAAAASVSRALPSGATLFASNSMSIRLVDLAHHGSGGPVRVLCNRGASGIDGITSSALGVAAAGPGPTLLLTGDLALLHDLGGLLMARQEAIDLAIVVLDDDGGGIFSFLPIAEQGEAVGFERLFGTPHGLDLSRVAALFELDSVRVASTKELDLALGASLRRGGVSLIHVPLDRRENEACFRALLMGVTASVDAGIAT